MRKKGLFSALSAALWLKFWLEVLHSPTTDAWALFPKFFLANDIFGIYLGWVWKTSEFDNRKWNVSWKKGYKKLNATPDRPWSQIAFGCLLLSAEVACCIWHFRDGNSFFRVHLRLNGITYTVYSISFYWLHIPTVLTVATLYSNMRM